MRPTYAAIGVVLLATVLTTTTTTPAVHAVPIVPSGELPDDVAAPDTMEQPLPVPETAQSVACDEAACTKNCNDRYFLTGYCKDNKCECSYD